MCFQKVPGNSKFNHFHQVKIVPILWKSTDSNQNLIYIEGGQDAGHIRLPNFRPFLACTQKMPGHPKFDSFHSKFLWNWDNQQTMTIFNQFWRWPREFSMPNLRLSLPSVVKMIPWNLSKWTTQKHNAPGAQKGGKTNSWHINTLRPRQNGCHLPEDILKHIFLNENIWISLKVSLKFVPKVPINNIPALVLIMAWRRPGDKPLSEQMMVSLPTHICTTRPQWVKQQFLCVSHFPMLGCNMAYVNWMKGICNVFEMTFYSFHLAGKCYEKNIWKLSLGKVIWYWPEILCLGFLVTIHFN